MTNKHDLIFLKTKLKNEYEALNKALHECIYHEASASNLDELYENLMEAGFEASARTKAYFKYHEAFKARVKHRVEARALKTPTLYPYESKKVQHENQSV